MARTWALKENSVNTTIIHWYSTEHLVDIEHIKKLLSSRFEMKDMKELHYFLGIEVIRTPDGIMLSQRHYILNLLYKFGMTKCKPVTTPLD